MAKATGLIQGNRAITISALSSIGGIAPGAILAYTANYPYLNRRVVLLRSAEFVATLFLVTIFTISLINIEGSARIAIAIGIALAAASVFSLYTLLQLVKAITAAFSRL